jgi:SAM-dependent methyltransferase
MTSKYEDHFSGHAEAYARHRPRYPGEIYEWLASLARERELAWDVGTGNGQVAGALAGHFARVVATDASADQLRHAMPHERVEYRHEPADRVTLTDRTVDLISAGAAAHWFELDGFYREVRRVAKPGAVIALWSYGPRDIADAFAPIVHRYQEEILRDYWPERIRYVHERYATLPFPFVEIEAPRFEMSAEWTLREFLGFLATWSASQRYLEEHGRHPLDEIAAELEEAWGDAGVRRRIAWPLFFRVGRV